MMDRTGGAARANPGVARRGGRPLRTPLSLSLQCAGYLRQRMEGNKEPIHLPLVPWAVGRAPHDGWGGLLPITPRTHSLCRCPWGSAPLHSELGWAAWVAPRLVPARAIFFWCPQDMRLCLPSSDNPWAPRMGTTPHQCHVSRCLS